MTGWGCTIKTILQHHPEHHSEDVFMQTPFPSPSRIHRLATSLQMSFWPFSFKNVLQNQPIEENSLSSVPNDHLSRVGIHYLSRLASVSVILLMPMILQSIPTVNWISTLKSQPHPVSHPLPPHKPPKTLPTYILPLPLNLTPTLNSPSTPKAPFQEKKKNQAGYIYHCVDKPLFLTWSYSPWFHGRCLEVLCSNSCQQSSDHICETKKGKSRQVKHISWITTYNLTVACSLG